MSEDFNARSDAEFRQLVANFVEKNCPRELRFPFTRLGRAAIAPWYQALSRGGWLCPGWPVEYGGMGLSGCKQLIYIEEMERNGAPRMPDQGIMNLGPLLIAHGSETQKKEYLPKILSGEHIWCQGYSEPNAGSDLADLRTEARIEGNEFVVNGHKIWTSMAFDADMMFALVRTDKSGPKQAGISFLIIDMDQPGITVRPIENIAGHKELCEVFIDDARAPLENLIGKMHDGWRISKTLLGFERIWAGSPRQSQQALFRLQGIAALNGKAGDPLFQDKMLQLELDVLDLAASYELATSKLKSGQALRHEASYLKIWATETCQKISELILETAGDLAALDGEVPIGGDTCNPTQAFFESRAATIYGGTSQVQRNILAKTALELPTK